MNRCLLPVVLVSLGGAFSCGPSVSIGDGAAGEGGNTGTSSTAGSTQGGSATAGSSAGAGTPVVPDAGSPIVPDAATTSATRCAASGASGASGATAVLAALRASYRFDDSSGPYAVDSSEWSLQTADGGVGSGHGTIYLAERIDGVSGKALRFGSLGARVELPALGEVFSGNQISIELWLRPADLGGVQQLVGDGTFGLQSFRLELAEGKLVFRVAQGGNLGPAVITSRATLDIGRWQLATVTLDGSTAHIYLDGVLDVSSSAITPAITPIESSYNTLYVGAVQAQDFSWTNQLGGDIDELRIWNIALTAQQVSAHCAPPPNP